MGSDVSDPMRPIIVVRVTDSRDDPAEEQLERLCPSPRSYRIVGRSRFRRSVTFTIAPVGLAKRHRRLLSTSRMWSYHRWWIAAHVAAVCHCTPVGYIIVSADGGPFVERLRGYDEAAIDLRSQGRSVFTSPKSTIAVVGTAKGIERINPLLTRGGIAPLPAPQLRRRRQRSGALRASFGRLAVRKSIAAALIAAGAVSATLAGSPARDSIVGRIAALQAEHQSFKELEMEKQALSHRESERYRLVRSDRAGSPAAFLALLGACWAEEEVQIHDVMFHNMEFWITAHTATIVPLLSALDGNDAFRDVRIESVRLTEVPSLREVTLHGIYDR